MIKVLIIKEIRDALWVAVPTFTVLTLWHFGYINAVAVPGSRPQFDELPFMVSGLAGWLATILGLMTVFLGVKQSVWETYLFLLHRPIRRRMIFLIKLIVGVGIYFMVASTPVLLMVHWASTPGSAAGPFEWWMTLDAWRVVLAMPLLYFGAFLTGIRPARWYGTRLLPLVCGMILAVFLAFFPLKLYLTFLVVIVFAALFLLTIFSIARARGYA